MWLTCSIFNQNAFNSQMPPKQKGRKLLSLSNTSYESQSGWQRWSSPHSEWCYLRVNNKQPPSQKRRNFNWTQVSELCEKAVGEQRSAAHGMSAYLTSFLTMLNGRFFQIKMSQIPRIHQNELKRQMHNIPHILHLLNTIISWTVAGKYETKFSFVTLKSNFFIRQAILLRIT